MENTKELEAMIRNIVKEIKGSGTAVNSSGTSGSESKDGIFQDVDSAIVSAKKAQQEYSKCSMDIRNQVVEAIRTDLKPYVGKIAKDAVEETGMGKVEDKITKINLALNKTPGVEDLRPETFTGDHGMALYELTPYGVIGAVTPSTNPPATLINNAIGMLAAGNAIFFSVHPGAKKVSRWLVSKLNEIAFKVTGINNLVVTIEEPSIEAAQKMMQHPDIAILVVTGGPGVVRQALSSGKKTIGAGAGNPPALVDETADIAKAGKDIVWGASFDNNVLCTAEKSVVVVESVANRLIESMQSAGAYVVKDERKIKHLLDMTLTDKGPNKKYIGKDASFILDAAGLPYTGDPKLIIMKTEKTHPFVIQEMLMPIVPIVTVNNFEEACETAVMIEQGLKHTATMHSKDLTRINKVAKVINTTIFVVNGPSFAGLGVMGEGPTTLTIATPTGEGTTSARHFARRRRMVVTDGFSLK
ncbi:aldehyde dehydrogenase EutE [Desemzia sp. C1]|uniref:aldehyde dehydrogenase family protein n=1 Tax=Desemzia sp. C1 TaxID=2892016 RepID=UPI001E2D4999|nr:aldehyde dehydrogenase family protein [Desemzia sp. C1]MCI3029308.1 aldehyde dehydrogenase EutE [Desemzia sp. C1]